ncbi:MAG: hypothetical protein P0Y53_21600 [Candidatus Pseudobacter hemicellulosilyticus]|uniref:Uncharacterized protein n=1 Tax=Candidatus Pseudobacter hemicellulosilyticus TaxID=3121375 RepID=A0AAJ5WRB2_9BACT|nr:MAG: hypothetical protein P0Y53_21600 [Pseudobacter sp.]
MTENEQQFLQYWEASREREGRWQYQLMSGIPIGLLFSLPILFIMFTSRLWYKRADMVANTTSPWLFVVAVIIIAVFVAVFYKRFQWERKEQFYKELKAKARREQDQGPVQL